MVGVVGKAWVALLVYPGTQMKYWKTDRNRWLDTHPFDSSEAWCAEIRKVHTDTFRVVPVEGGFVVEQGVP